MLLLRIVSTTISVYLLLVFLRIIMTWFSGFDLGPVNAVLARIVDPYLDVFRRIRFLHIGAFDFSVIVAVIVLSITRSSIEMIIGMGSVSLGAILALIVAALWSAIRFFGLIFLIIAVVRVIGLLVRVSSIGRFWYTLDQLLQPIIAPFVRLFGRIAGPRTIVPYGTALMLFAGILLMGGLVGSFAIDSLVRLLILLPF